MNRQSKLQRPVFALFLCIACIEASATRTARGVNFGDILEPEQFNCVGCVHVTSVREDKDGELDLRGAIGTGTLIGPTLVITAAHVVRSAASPLHIRFRLDGGNETLRAVSFQIHRGFDAYNKSKDLGGIADDIALIRLERGPSLTRDVYPLLLDGAPKPDEAVIIVGYGSDESQTNNVRRSGGLKFYREHNGFHCFVAGRERYQKPDHGDSGGPLLLQRDGSYRICSLVQGVDNADTEELAKAINLDPIDVGFFVSVARHRDWLKKRIEAAAPSGYQGVIGYVWRTQNADESAFAVEEVVTSLRNRERPESDLLDKVVAAGLSEPITSDILTEIRSAGASEGFLERLNTKTVRPLTFEEFREALKGDLEAAEDAFFRRGLIGGLNARQIETIQADGATQKVLDVLKSWKKDF